MHIARLIRFFLSCFLFIIISACAPWYSYDGVKYSSSVEALEAARQDIRGKVSAVPKRANPIGGSVLVFAPTVKWSRQGVQVTGNVADDVVRYVATVLHLGWFAMAMAIEQRGIFETIHIQQFSQRDPLGNPDYDYLIWLRLDGPDDAQWMISPGDDTSRPQPLFVSPVADPADRITDFLESVERNLLGNVRT